MLDRAIGIIGVALALIFGLWSLAPEGWPKMPHWLVYVGVALGILLVGLSAGLLIADQRNPKIEAQHADTASLQLHFFGDERVPTLINSTNLWRWYYLRNLLVSVNEETKEKKEATISNLYISFDKPVKVGTLEVRSPDIQLPRHEVKEFTNRYAIIAITDAMPAGTLEISVHQ